MEERSDFIRPMHKMMQCASCFQCHVRKAEYSGPANSVRLHFAPDFLRGIQLRAIRRKQIQTQATLVVAHLGGHDTRLVYHHEKPDPVHYPGFPLTGTDAVSRRSVKGCLPGERWNRGKGLRCHGMAGQKLLRTPPFLSISTRNF